MAVDTNGSLKGPKAANGANGHANGIANGIKMNGHAVAVKRRPASPPRAGLVARSISFLTRIFTWYAILTVLFRCPASLDQCDGSSPRICSPYFHAKHAIAPRLEPYYDAYAAPYVGKARPYYEKVDQAVLTPVWGYATRYGAPRVAQAQAYSQAQWGSKVQPQIAKAQALAKAQYDQSLAPHVDRLSSAVGPYYDIARTNALQTYHDLILPGYSFVEPYALHGYQATSAFATKTAIPSAAWAWNQTYAFLDRTVWPQLRAVYVENVEPQLVKIGQRLGRYKGSAAQKAAEPRSSTASKVASSFTKPAQSVTSSVPAANPAGTTSSVETAPTEAADATEAPLPTSEPAATASAPLSHISREPVAGPVDDEDEPRGEVRRIARETVAEDLQAWQEKYAKAADEGAAEIEERVNDIAKRMIRRQARATGKSLIEQLETVVEAELAALRGDIRAAADGSATGGDAEEQVVAAVRRAGKAIRDKAQDVRTWRENYDAELKAAITKAAESPFQILESIRDLALQKIGMKWAWMDGVTYKDWARFHQLKDRFEEWHADLERLIVTNPSLEQAHAEGQAVEDRAMEVAQAAAAELARLKQVGAWKVAARDDSDDFDADTARLAAEAALSAASETVEAATEALPRSVAAGAAAASESVESVASVASETASQAAESASSAATEATSSVVDTATSVYSDASLAASSVASTVSSAASETPSSLVESLVDNASSGASAVSESAATIAGEASEATVGTSEPNAGSEAVEPETSAGPTPSKVPDDLAADATSVLLAETPIVAGNTSEVTEPDGPVPAHVPVDEVGEPVDNELSDNPPPPPEAEPIKSAFLGAAAQAVPSHAPILEDNAFDAVKEVIETVRAVLPSSISAMASAAYSLASSRAAKQYSQATSAVSIQVHGTPEPAHQQILSSASSIYNQALASANSQFDEALKFASSGLWPTSATNILPTAVPTLVDWSRVEAIAAERLNEGRSWAERQYENARVAAGLATPTPTDVSGTLSSAASVASESLSSGASAASASLSSGASAAGESFASVTAAAGENVDKLLQKAQYNYYAGLGVAHARYSEFLSSASSAFSSLTATPTPTDFAGTASSVASVASESAASVASVVSENASSIGDTAGSAASAGYDSVSSAASAGYDYVGSAGAAGYESASSAAAAGYDNLASAADTAGSAVQDRWDALVNQLSTQVYGAPEPTPWYESFYSVAEAYASSVGGYASSATSAAGEGAATVTRAAGAYGAAASEEAARQYASVSSIVSELLVGKEPTFSESVYSRLRVAYSTATASVVSAASAASEAAGSAADKAASAASDATEAVKETVASVKDEL